jgi:hypothetical protein
MWVLVGVEGGSGLLDSVPDGGIGGQLVHVGLHGEHLGAVVLEGALEGGECRRRSPQSLLSDEHLHNNLLRLAVHDKLLVVLVLGHFHGNLLRLGVRVLGGDDVGLECRRVQLLLLHVEFLRLTKRHVNLVLDALGGGEGGVTSLLLLHGELLSLSSHLVHLHGDLLRLAQLFLMFLWQ